MRISCHFLLALFAVVTSSFGQPTRIELLSRSDNHARRVGASAMAAVAEFSRDGNYVLFLSEASNLTTNKSTAKPVLNLFMTDRQTGETTLLSEGANGEPANDNVVNFELSADNKRVLIETAASNLISNDTNNAVDVFVRDLTLKTNILVSAKTNGQVARYGAGQASMSADGTTVTFTAGGDHSFSTDYNIAFTALYVRDLAAGKTDVVPLSRNLMAMYFREASVSPDGRYISFNGDFMTTTRESGTFLYDRQTQTPYSTRLDAAGPNFDWEPIMTGNGKFVVFATQSQLPANPVTNTISRFSVELGTTEMVVSNTAGGLVRPFAVSEDGTRILGFYNGGYGVYRDGAEMRVFPRAADGSQIRLAAPFGNAAMSADGRVVTFTTETPLLPEQGGVEQFRTYLYDVEQDSLTVLPLSSPRAPVSDPAPNADGSLVVFTAAEGGIQDETEPLTWNIYLWERATGAVTLLSKSHPGAYENTVAGDSKLREADSISDDGRMVVFTSTAPARGVVDTNRTLDVFVLDRLTGHQEVLSLLADGSSTGSGPSFSPIISGNGRMVAFLSRATNLINISRPWAQQIFVRDLQSGVTKMITNTNGEPTSGGHFPGAMSFDRDGKRLVFSGMKGIDPRPAFGQRQHVYVYDVAMGTSSLVSYNSTGESAANGDSTGPVISADGKLVAFRSDASDLGVTGGGVYIRDLTDGSVKRPSNPNGGFTSGVSNRKLLFDPTSTTLFYGATGAVYQAYNVAQNTQTRLATRAVEASVSTNQQWVAFSRQFTGVFPVLTQIILRDVISGTETLVSSNRTTGLLGNQSSTRPKISPDGRFVIFQSRASNLVDNDTNECADIFMYERQTQRMHMVTRGLDGALTTRASLRPVMSPDNSFVAFISYASNIAEHDYNMSADIFAAHLPGPDTDTDFIDDRWETNHFGSLTHDMAGDADGDGLTDSMEFAAGTDPEAASSTVRVVAADVGEEGNVVVRWLAVPGRSYRVQARATFDPQSSWQDLSDTIVASRADMEITLPMLNAASEFYFRIVAVP